LKGARRQHRGVKELENFEIALEAINREKACYLSSSDFFSRTVSGLNWMGFASIATL
jgi:hypothetical protein